MSPWEVPVELAACTGGGGTDDGPSPGGGGGRGGGRGGSGKGRDESQRHKRLIVERELNDIGERLAAKWSKTVGPALQSAKKAVAEKGNKDWTLAMLYPEGAAKAFGGMVDCLKVGPTGHKKPCPRYFTNGECVVQKCNNCHVLEREPTNEQGRRFTDWVEKRCAEIKADPSKA